MDSDQMTDGTAQLVPSVVYVPQPAAGAGFTYRTPGSVFQELIACSFDIATSAVAGTRTPVLELVDGTGRVIVGAAAGVGIIASSTGRYTYCRGLSEWDFAGAAFASGPVWNVPLVLGEAVTLAVNGIDVGDQVTNIALVLLAQPTN